GQPNDDGTIWALAEGPDGTLWIGSNRGIERFDAARGVALGHHDRTPAELGIRGVGTLLWDHAGNLWVGGRGGLNLLRQAGAGVTGCARRGRASCFRARKKGPRTASATTGSCRCWRTPPVACGWAPTAAGSTAWTRTAASPLTRRRRACRATWSTASSGTAR